MKSAVCALAVILAVSSPSSRASGDPSVHPVTTKGHELAEALDAMGVETKWIAGVHVDWRTGLPDGRPERAEGRHTHCSAFVAAAAMKLGVYILRPPQHAQMLLANAQNEWLAEEGGAEGWRSLPGPIEAQNAANDGAFVVASYHNRHDDKPGHIAIVRPAERNAAEIAADGPEVIQAGSINSADISLKAGFSGHPHAWADHEVRFYAHSLAASSN